MGTESTSLDTGYFHEDLWRLQQVYTHDPTLLVLRANPLLGVWQGSIKKKNQTPKHKNPEIPTKINCNLWDSEKRVFSSIKPIVFFSFHITHWSLPRFSTKITLLHNKLFSPWIRQAKIPEFPITDNNIHLLPMNGNSDLTDGTLRNRI